MAIEQAIYGSIPQGIDTNTAGYQYYSYTAGYKAIIEQDKRLGAVLVSSYEAPATYGYYYQYSASNKTDEDKQRASEQAELEHPFSFRYRPISILGTKKATFSFSKDMGLDWSGGRPLSVYSCAVICDEEEIKKAPIYYCASPVVCCNIQRKEFYLDAETGKRPELLPPAISLDKDSPNFPLQHEAGFVNITTEDIMCFIRDEGRFSIFQKMLTALLQHKDGMENCKIVIADRTEYILYWIAALSSVFPLQNTLNFSFNTYGNRIEDYDVNGVFVPSLNSVQPGNGVSATRYNAHDAQKNSALFDFSQNIIAPNIVFENGPFWQMLKASFLEGSPLLEQYKNYIISKSCFVGMDSQYIAGYALFDCLYGTTGGDINQLKLAVKFAQEFASMEERSKFLRYLYQLVFSSLGNDEIFQLFQQYYQFVKQTGKVKDQSLIQQSIGLLLQSLSNDKADSLDEFYNLGERLEQLFCLDKGELPVLFVDTVGLDKLIGLASQSQGKWKLDYFHASICSYVAAGRTSFQRGGSGYQVAYITIRQLIVDDDSTNRKRLQGLIEKMIHQINSGTQPLYYLCAISDAMEANGFKNCLADVKRYVGKLYLSCDAQGRSDLLSKLYYDNRIESFMPSILQEINMLSDAHTAVKMFQEIADETEAAYVRQIAEYLFQLNNSRESSLYFEIAQLLFLWKQKGWLRLTKQKTVELWSGFFDSYCDENPDFHVDSGKAQMLETLFSAMTAMSTTIPKGHQQVVAAYLCISELSENLAQGIYEGFVEKRHFSMVDYSLLPAYRQDQFLTSISELYVRYWSIDARSFPAGINNMFVVSSKTTQNAVYVDLLLKILNCAISMDKIQIRLAVDILEMIDLENQEDATSDAIGLLIKNGVRGKEVLRTIERDLNALSSGRRSFVVNDMAEKLGVPGLATLQERVKTTYANAPQRGGFRTVRDAVKGIFGRGKR